MTKTVEILAWLGSRIGRPPGWERFVRLFASPEKCRAMPDVCLVRDGVAFLAQPGVPLGWHVAFFGTYEPELRDIVRTVLPLGGVAVDVGANVGWHTLLMARLVGQGGRVLAAEANPSVRKRLNGNLELNRFAQVEIVPYAISDAEGTVEFFGPDARDPASGDGHVVASAQVEVGTFRVESRRLDSILESAHVTRLDLLKIDVEGFEWPVLKGAEAAVAKYRPHIIFEYDADYASRGMGTPALMEDYFRKHGYRLFAITRVWSEAIEPGRWPRCADIWAVPAS